MRLSPDPPWAPVIHSAAEPATMRRPSRSAASGSTIPLSGVLITAAGGTCASDAAVSPPSAGAGRVIQGFRDCCTISSFPSPLVGGLEAGGDGGRSRQPCPLGGGLERFIAD